MQSARLLAVVLSFLYRLVHRAFGALDNPPQTSPEEPAETLAEAGIMPAWVRGAPSPTSAETRSPTR